MLYTSTMHELNNKQMVLLTMLVSFVVSVGTGIVTVAMLEEAPPVLTQTVNRVVERTIERVVTGSSTPEKNTTQPVTSVTKEVTIYAKEDDLIISAVAKNQPRIALVYGLTQSTSTSPLAVGFIVSRDGVIAVDLKSISTDAGVSDGYTIVIGGNSYSAKPMKSGALSAATPLALLKIDYTQSGTTFDAVVFGRQVEPRIAQTFIALGGGDGSGVFKGTLSRFHYGLSEGTTTPPLMTSIDTAPSIPSDNVGALVVNLDAQALGIVVNNFDGDGLVIYPVSRILDLINAVSVEASHPSAMDTASDKASAS